MQARQRQEPEPRENRRAQYEKRETLLKASRKGRPNQGTQVQMPRIPTSNHREAHNHTKGHKQRPRIQNWHHREAHN